MCNQDYRRDHCPEVAQQIDDFIRKLDKYIEGDEDIMPFTFELDDPSGHSNIKNPMAPLADICLTTEKYVRSVEQIVAMGFTPENVGADKAEVDEPKKENSKENSPEKEVSMKREENPTIVRETETLQAKNQKHLYTEKETNEIIQK